MNDEQLSFDLLLFDLLKEKLGLIELSAKEVLEHHKNSGEKFSGVNYADLFVRDVYMVYHMDGETTYVVEIEECSPTAYDFMEFIGYELEKTLGYSVRIECEW